MAAQLSLTKADAHAPDGTVHEGKMVIVRGNILKVVDRYRGGAVIEVEGVTAVETVRRGREWTIRFGDAPAWSIHRTDHRCAVCP